MPERIYLPITRDDLEYLDHVAAVDRERFFAQHPLWAEQYHDRFLATALCQGAALHMLDGTNGVKDFDVYSFYAKNEERIWYPKRIKRVVFGDDGYGVPPANSDFTGRRIDLLGRSLPVRVGSEPATAIREWLTNRHGSARYLAEKAVVLLSPADRLGEVVWPANIQRSVI